MPITVQTSTPKALEAVIRALACWQRDGLPVQLHPGDLGWHGRFGTGVLAGSLRVWSRDDEIVAMGLVDGDVIRMALAPSVDQDDDVGRALVRDLEDFSAGCCLPEVPPSRPASGRLPIAAE
jgi:hypothetical protein